MTIDLIWVGRQLLGDLFLVEKQAFDEDCAQRRLSSAYSRAAVMMEIMRDMDRLNQAHDAASVDWWLHQARGLGSTPAIKDYYEMNARRLITTWGGGLNDYACRNWSGLLLDYYAQRWQRYLVRSLVSADLGIALDTDMLNEELAQFQEQWVSEHVAGDKRFIYTYDVLTLSRLLRDKYRQQLDAWTRNYVE